jgi:hypothetical protein
LGNLKPAPDYNCKIEPPPAPAGSHQQMPAISPGSTVPPGATSLPSSLDPADFQLSGVNIVLKPSQYIHGDPAEGNIPRYLITFTDPFGIHHTCRASADEQYPHYGPIAHAVSFRHRFRYSMGVLCAMMVVLVAGVIGILRKRDNDPQ